MLHPWSGVVHSAGVADLPPDEIIAVVRRALAEDLGPGDVTSLATIEPTLRAEAVMVTRQKMVVAGLPVVRAVLAEVARDAAVTELCRDGDSLEAETPLLRVTGLARGILAAERVALNFVQRLSGIATLTARYVDAVQGSKAQIRDTRKTTPTLRFLEKYAVRKGGGVSHRSGLFDMVLIKDNHLAALANSTTDAVGLAVRRARERFPDLKVEVEADTLGQVEKAVTAGADIILLDNMSPEQMRAAVRLVAGRAKTEASGGITLESARGVAECGVDYISAGALTHSAPAMDIALDFVVEKTTGAGPARS